MTNEQQKEGEKSNHIMQIRLSKSQWARLQTLAKASGYNVVSEFVRFQCLNPSLEVKINEILALIKKGEKK